MLSEVVNDLKRFSTSSFSSQCRISVSTARRYIISRQKTINSVDSFASVSLVDLCAKTA